MKTTPGSGGGLIGVFARHPTAANLLMLLMIICGLFALTRLNKQFFPDFGIDIIIVTVEWPGASAEDVDSNIVQAIEPEVRFLDGVKDVRASSYEGLASIWVEYEAGHDMQGALTDVESAVAQVRTLPEDAERPDVRRAVRYDTIARLVISGPYPEASLKAIAKEIRDDLLERGIDKVDIFGARDEEVWAEVRPETLRRLDLTLGDIAGAIRATSQDLPSGDIAGGERQVRSLGLRKDAASIGTIEIKALANGRRLLLRDIADIHDTFEEGGQTAVRNGQPAVELHIQRAVNADALDLARITDDYLAGARGRYPPNLHIEQYDVQASLIKDRIRVLLSNGASGLVLVLVILFIFLNGRVAFWVAVGIPASLAATLGLMWLSGQSINMVSLFGLIMAIGIVVDDAIVVGEHAQARAATGMLSLDAAINGATRMAAPVISSTLTTIAAFVPLLVISGIIGEIITAIPFVVITVLIASLFECFLVLPGHLRGALGPHHDRAGNPFIRFRHWFDRGFGRFREGPFRRLVSIAVAWRYSTVTLALAALILAIGLIIGGRVGFQFFPSPESDKVYANVQMVSGSSRAQTRTMLEEVDRALHQAADKLAGPGNDLVRMSLIKLGTSVGGDRGNDRAAATDTIGGLAVELKPADRRHIRNSDLLPAWRAAVRQLPGLDTLTLRAAHGGPPGRDVDVKLSGDSVASLKAAAEEVRLLLARYPGISAISDNLPWGKPETILRVTPRGRALGFTTEEVGRQVRNALEGAIAKRFPRGDEEVLVRVQYPRASLGSDALERLYLRSPTGQEVPLSEVVAMHDEIGFARIKRENGHRLVSVFAEIDKRQTSTGEVISSLLRDGLRDIAQRHGVSYEFGGKAEEQRDTFGDMEIGALIGLSAIYIILAWVFSSYTRPLVVMGIIPMGFVGTVIGHLLLGYELTILSMVALIGLSGIVINDSIVLVTTIDERRRSEPLTGAIIDGTCDRLRAVILTSATTIGGLTPLLFEKSLQAQFLIPMAVTIVFGLTITTLVVLFLVPALIAIQDDLGRLFRSRPIATTGLAEAP